MRQFLIVSGFLFFLGGGFLVFSKLKGLRNNNAGNIRSNPNNQWQEQTGEDSDGFAIFSSPEWGLRAMAKLLLNYQQNSGLKTIRELINRWAPPIENDTDSYVNSVSKRMGINSDTPLSLSVFGFVTPANETTLRELMKAIVTHENGFNPFSDDLFNKAIGLV